MNYIPARSIIHISFMYSFLANLFFCLFTLTLLLTLTDTKITCDRFLLFLRGLSGAPGQAMDMTHRRHAKAFGVFRDIWPENNGSYSLVI